jgi:hypothetical protein
MENRDDSPKEVRARPVLAVPTPPERLVGVAYDRTGKRLLLITEDYLINVLNTDVPQVVASFEGLCAEDLKILSSIEARISSVLLLGVKSSADSQLFTSCGRLLLNANNSLIAAIQLLARGTRWHRDASGRNWVFAHLRGAPRIGSGDIRGPRPVRQWC